MNDKDFADIIRLVRRASLHNMDEAEHVAGLLQRFASHANEFIETQKQNKLPLKAVEK
jgi:hypothetical protein